MTTTKDLIGKTFTHGTPTKEALDELYHALLTETCNVIIGGDGELAKKLNTNLTDAFHHLANVANFRTHDEDRTMDALRLTQLNTLAELLKVTFGG